MHTFSVLLAILFGIFFPLVTAPKPKPEPIPFYPQNVETMSSESLVDQLGKIWVKGLNEGAPIIGRIHFHYRTEDFAHLPHSEDSDECKKARMKCEAFIQCPFFCEYAHTPSPCWGFSKGQWKSVSGTGNVDKRLCRNDKLRKYINPCSLAMYDCYGIPVKGFEEVMRFKHADEY